MSTRAKWTAAGVVVLLLSVWLLPLVVRRIDSRADTVWEKAAAREAEYRDMTNAYPIAGEVTPDHPTRRLWEERRAALLKIGYIETRELSMPHALPAKHGAQAFFSAFHARFPGVECSVRAVKSNAPLVVVTARKSDFGPFGPIEQFVTRYEPPK
jgi:hypothetical protein